MVVRSPNARSRPRALARVSSSSRSGTESATMPAPARSSMRVAAHGQRADQDVEVRVTVGAQPAQRAGVRAPPLAFQRRR